MVTIKFIITTLTLTQSSRQQGTFCLVLQGGRGRLDTGTLLECMAAGAIPVVLADPIVLPFVSFIDWGRFGGGGAVCCRWVGWVRDGLLGLVEASCCF